MCHRPVQVKLNLKFAINMKVFIPQVLLERGLQKLSLFPLPGRTKAVKTKKLAKEMQEKVGFNSFHL